MTALPTRVLLLAALLVSDAVAARVLVVSVDGLDARYLLDADAMHLRMPTIRRIMREGESARGVFGVVPTVTWPSHTTIISGVIPEVHGILNNRRPREEGGENYWFASLLKVPTLLNAAKRAGKTTAAITWPVTVGAPLDYNLPEYFRRRQGGSMDFESVTSKAVPADLADRIAKVHPEFRGEWIDDRTRTQATIFLIRRYHPDLMLVHLVDLDAAAHEHGPFSPEANKTLESIDGMLGEMLAALPSDYVFVLTSDHGFEAVDREVNIGVLAKRDRVGGIEPRGGIVCARSEAGAEWLRRFARKPDSVVGREIPHSEVERLAPRLASMRAIFESAPHVWFGAAEAGPVETKAHEPGAHGHWPTRYRSVFVVWGAGVSKRDLGEIQMTSIAARLAGFLGIEFRPGK